MTYPVNENVRKAIEDDPNIVSKAMRTLDANKRRLLDESLASTRDNIDWNRSLAPKVNSEQNQEKQEEVLQKKEKNFD